MWDIPWTAETGIGFLTLTLMEIVLGMDNIIFISILVGKLACAASCCATEVLNLNGT